MRSEPEALLDAQALVRLAEEYSIAEPGMMEEVRDLLVDLYQIGTPTCLEAARIVSRKFAVVISGKETA